MNKIGINNEMKRDKKVKMSSSSFGGNSDNEDGEINEIRSDLANMSFEEIIKLKDELGAKVYKEAVLGVSKPKEVTAKHKQIELKRLNKNRPRELPSTRQVRFSGADQRRLKYSEQRDPRFEEACGTYDSTSFKNNYKFVTKIRRKEATVLKKELDVTTNDDERREIKKAMQKLLNKNVEEGKWHARQKALKQEQQETQRVQAEGRQPHYTTKKERLAQQLVSQFEELKLTGKLNKHLEKRRKKNAAKDRRRLHFD